MKTIIIIVSILAVGIIGFYIVQEFSSPTPGEDTPDETVGAQRDEHGCLTPAGYAFDADIGACIRAFEMTDDIARAAALAVDEVGGGYALTVASFNSYEDEGSYDIVLERGVERTQRTVYIRNWTVVENPTTEKLMQ